jgi:hypothetical protein
MGTLHFEYSFKFEDGTERSFALPLEEETGTRSARTAR